MAIIVEAVYEAGIFKPLKPPPNLKEHEKVRLIIESISLIAEQRQKRIEIDPAIAQQIGNWPDYDLLEG